MVLENELRVLHLDPQATERNCDTTPSLKACDFKAFLHSHTLSPTRTNLLQQGHSTQLCTPCGLTFKYLILCGSYSSSSAMIPESQAQDLICRCIHFVALWKHFFSWFTLILHSLRAQFQTYHFPVVWSFYLIKHWNFECMHRVSENNSLSILLKC